MAVLPNIIKLAILPIISLDQLAKEFFILLDEGRHSVIMHAFTDYKLEPQIEYIKFMMIIRFQLLWYKNKV